MAANLNDNQLYVGLQVEGYLALLTLKGWVNMDTSDHLADKVRDFVAREGAVRFLVDARELEYVSSAGVGVFIDLYDRYENRGGRICFVGLQPQVRRVLELVGFMSFFGDAADEASAKTFLRK